MASKGADRYDAQFHKALEGDRFADTYPGSILTKLTVEKLSDAIAEWRTEALSGPLGRRNRSAKAIEGMDTRAIAYVAIRRSTDNLSLFPEIDRAKAAWDKYNDARRDMW
ncbi:hypothetical protein FQ775_04375 [Nitratireductor mangrovi]|uniref:Uncharacterized protein n=1 Tax=Nitratireductor mangrovi TaxID=2599600 RepID=A0A5B8KVX4_9HYPH|nr:hypothetical protein [Nitratireductor mangrovi]QDY99669.1 hypothetical protein FQ775_04375 [Nitratireductor mangrovi]